MNVLSLYFMTYVSMLLSNIFANGDFAITIFFCLMINALGFLLQFIATLLYVKKPFAYYLPLVREFKIISYLRKLDDEETKKNIKLSSILLGTFFILIITLSYGTAGEFITLADYLKFVAMIVLGYLLGSFAVLEYCFLMITLKKKKCIKNLVAIRSFIYYSFTPLVYLLNIDEIFKELFKHISNANKTRSRRVIASILAFVISLSVFNVNAPYVNAENVTVTLETEEAEHENDDVVSYWAYESEEDDVSYFGEIDVDEEGNEEYLPSSEGYVPSDFIENEESLEEETTNSVTWFECDIYGNSHEGQIITDENGNEIYLSSEDGYEYGSDISYWEEFTEDDSYTGITIYNDEGTITEFLPSTEGYVPENDTPKYTEEDVISNDNEPEKVEEKTSSKKDESSSVSKTDSASESDLEPLSDKEANKIAEELINKYCDYSLAFDYAVSNNYPIKVAEVIMSLRDEYIDNHSELEKYRHSRDDEKSQYCNASNAYGRYLESNGYDYTKALMAAMENSEDVSVIEAFLNFTVKSDYDEDVYNQALLYIGEIDSYVVNSNSSEASDTSNSYISYLEKYKGTISQDDYDLCISLLEMFDGQYKLSLLHAMYNGLSTEIVKALNSARNDKALACGLNEYYNDDTSKICEAYIAGETIFLEDDTGVTIVSSNDNDVFTEIIENAINDPWGEYRNSGYTTEQPIGPLTVEDSLGANGTLFYNPDYTEYFDWYYDKSCLDYDVLQYEYTGDAESVGEWIKGTCKNEGRFIVRTSVKLTSTLWDGIIGYTGTLLNDGINYIKNDGIENLKKGDIIQIYIDQFNKNVEICQQMLTGVVSIPISAMSSYAEFTQLALDGDMNSLYVLEDATSNTIIFAQVVDGVVKMHKTYKNAQNDIAKETTTTSNTEVNADSNTSTSGQINLDLQFFAEETKYKPSNSLVEHLGKGSINTNGRVSGAHTFDALRKLNPELAYDSSLYKEFFTDGQVLRQYDYVGKNGTSYTKTVSMGMTANEMVSRVTEAVNNNTSLNFDAYGQFHIVDSYGFKWTGFVDAAEKIITSCWPDYKVK